MEREELKKILLVEDDADISEIAKMTLETVGHYTVHHCESGTQAILEAPQFAPQLILLDVMMPTMDGPTTLKHLRENPSLANVPVIFMTAKCQQNEVAEYKNLGALDVIRKPFDAMTLPNLIQNIWNGGSS